MAVGGILSSGVVMIEVILVAIGLRTTSQHDILSPKKLLSIYVACMRYHLRGEVVEGRNPV